MNAASAGLPVIVCGGGIGGLAAALALVRRGLSVTVRKGQVETIEQNRDKVVGVTVMIGAG